ncbi:MAG: PilW family protein [Gammaproteobacteria bacterium]
MKKNRAFSGLHQEERGVTLIELMVAMVIALIVMAAVSGMFITTLRSNSDAMKMMRLNQELRAVMTLMTREIRRAGYFSGNSANYPTTYGSKWPDISFTATGFEYVYDQNENGVYDANDDFAFRWDGSAVEMFRGGIGTDLTDPDVVNVTSLRFNVSFVNTTGIEVRDVGITLRGQLVDDASVSREILDTVRVRNDIRD